jgi:NAD(P)-dependent dehydrogenase (short-subunit alcohol dehydrogenase family)
LKHDKFEEVVHQVSLLLGGAGLNVLVNNAGIDPEASLTESFYTENMLETYAVNAISPAQLTKVFLPLLKLGAASCKGDFNLKKSLIINMSSRHGSITNADSAMELPYKCSKV